jgi:hypothetical protein
MITGSWLTQALYVAAELGIADAVKSQALTSAEIAKQVNANTDAMQRILRALASVGIFAMRSWISASGSLPFGVAVARSRLIPTLHNRLVDAGWLSNGMTHIHPPGNRWWSPVHRGQDHLTRVADRIRRRSDRFDDECHNGQQQSPRSAIDGECLAPGR